MKLAVLCWKKAAHEEEKFLNLSVPSSIFVKKEIYVKKSRKGLLLLLLLGKWRYRKLPWFTKTKGVKFFIETIEVYSEYQKFNIANYTILYSGEKNKVT